MPGVWRSETPAGVKAGGGNPITWRQVCQLSRLKYLLMMNFSRWHQNGISNSLNRRFLKENYNSCVGDTYFEWHVCVELLFDIKRLFSPCPSCRPRRTHSWGFANLASRNLFGDTFFWHVTSQVFTCFLESLSIKASQSSLWPCSVDDVDHLN